MGNIMVTDARSLSDNTTIESDLVIVGAGASGITLAREFASSSVKVCLLESGGMELNPDTQALYSGENVGLEYFSLDACRARFFGGTTHYWAGWCQPLDAIDFEERDWIPFSGWPFGREHLDPYYRRAQPILQVGSLNYSTEAWETPGYAAIPFARNRAITKIYQYSTPPTNFSSQYGKQLTDSPNISVFLNCNVTEIESSYNARSVFSLKAQTLGKKNITIKGKKYILATGGIEVPRLLLLSNLGNEHDLVGRFFMEHPHLISGWFFLSSAGTSTNFYREHYVNGINMKGALSVSQDIQRKEKLVNFCATLVRKRRSDDFDQALADMVADIRSTELKNAHFYELYNRTEPSPNPDSRVTLSDKLDALGQRRTQLDWRLNELDKYSIRRTQEIIAEELGASGLGRFKVDLSEKRAPWPANLGGGFHHMGTTRMHRLPSQGVVDPDCRVHGMANLYIAGSSVFPTAGCANPMLTSTALTLRLADFLKGEMS